MTSPLFRPEVLDAQNAQCLGRICIGRSPRNATVAGIALLLTGTLVALAAWAEVTRKARIRGLPLPMLGTLQLAAAIATTLVKRRAAMTSRYVERYQELAGKSFVSALQAQSKQENLINLQGRAQAALRTVAMLQREQVALRAKQTASATQLQTALTQVDRSLATLARDSTEVDARRQLIVAAL